MHGKIQNAPAHKHTKTNGHMENERHTETHAPNYRNSRTRNQSGKFHNNPPHRQTGPDKRRSWHLYLKDQNMLHITRRSWMKITQTPANKSVLLSENHVSALSIASYPNQHKHKQDRNSLQMTQQSHYTVPVHTYSFRLEDKPHGKHMEEKSKP